MCALDPFQQWARVVETHANRGMTRKHFNEWQVGIRVGAFKYVVEISDRLMCVNQENQFKFAHQRTSGKVYSITSFHRTADTHFAPGDGNRLRMNACTCGACGCELR